MNTISVDLTSDSYQIHVGHHLLTQAGKLIHSCTSGSKILVVTHPDLNKLFGAELLASLESAGYSVTTATVPTGEHAKSFESYQKLVSVLAENRFTREDIVVAFGGGVIGDLAGFVAATYMRGCTLIHVPTSLLAMIDSSIGGKTSCGELIKYGVLSGHELFNKISLARNPVQVIDVTHRQELIQECIELKKSIVEADFKEAGSRKLLNLGHTLGHAIETLSNFELGHGSCVAAGTSMLAKACSKLGLCSVEDAENIITLTQSYNLPTSTSFSVEELYSAALHDKKSHADSIDVALIYGIGDVRIERKSFTELKQLIELAKED
ncbi:MAG: 3-dehydroquinate synthase [Atopobium sp.]|nr:3-dehydroquinate synthase [Atopobium sp.]